MFFILVGGSLWLLSNLDHPWLKTTVENGLSTLLGTNIRYQELSLSPFSGVRARGLVLATPESLREHAPDMLRIDELDMPIEFRPLLSGDVVIPEVTGRGAELTVVFAEDGRDSLSELARSEVVPFEVSVPLSESLEVLQEVHLTIRSVRLAPIRLRAIVEGEPGRDASVEPLALISDGLRFGVLSEGSAELRADGGNDVVLSVARIGDEDRGEGSVRRARFSPSLIARLENSRTLAVDARADLREQSLFPELHPVSSLVRVQSAAAFNPDQSTTTLVVERLEVLDAVVSATLKAVLEDPKPEETAEEGPLLAFSSAQLDGRGAFDVPSLPWVLPWLKVESLAGVFEMHGVRFDEGRLAGGRAAFEGRLGKARYLDGPLSTTLRGATWSADFSAPNGLTQTLGKLRLKATVSEATAREQKSFRGRVNQLAATLELTDLGREATGMWGLRGRGSLESSFTRGSLRARHLRAACEARASWRVDLAKHRVKGSLPIASLEWARAGHAPVSLRDARFDILAQQPTHWTSSDGQPTVTLEGSVARVAVGERTFRARKGSATAARVSPSRYSFEARGVADRVSWGRFQNAPESALTLSISLDAQRPAIDASVGLSIAGGIPTEVWLSASHDAPVTRYELSARGKEAGPLLGALVFRDGGRRNDDLDFSFESRGQLAGLLSTARSGAPVLSKEPLRTMRGTHESTLRVERLFLRREGILHQLGGLRSQASSTHAAPGRGTLRARAVVQEARFGDYDDSVSIRDFEHELELAYAALYGAPSFSIQTSGTLGQLDEPYVRQYPVRDVSFGAEVDVDDTQVVGVRRIYFHNPAGGTRLEARAAYEGWQSAIRDAEVCESGTVGCPKVVSMYGREAATVSGTLEQDFSSWKSTGQTRSTGSLTMPFVVESGDLNTFRVVATAEFRDVMLELPQYGLIIEDFDALIPVEQEFATAPHFFVVPSRASNAMAQKRFFDLYPFTKRDSYFTVDRLQLGAEAVGPVAANLQVVGSTLAVDQLHAAYRGGFITGQFLADLNESDPKVVFRGQITGVEPADGRGVLDANLAMTFVPTTLILEGKAQIVRISKDHLYDVIDFVDPYHEDEDLNRVRLGLRFGYPKFVVVKLDEGLMDAKVDLGGLAGAVRIDEIKGIPVTPFLEIYVQPYLERILSPSLRYDAAPAEKPSDQQRLSQALDGAR